MIHAAIFGAFERMIGILIEHYGGALPIWLAPVQAIILPISDKVSDYAKELLIKLQESGARVELDDRNESIGKKIREAELNKIPFMMIVGEREKETKKISVRRYGEGDKGQLDLKDVTKQIFSSVS